ncbi:MAG: ABC transporter permease [Prevotella sp.]
MRIDVDTYREILDTITRNKGRSFLTGFGVFWGIFMLVTLIGGGQGLKELLSNNFQGFATNSGIIFPQATTKPYHGFRKGRTWCMSYRDVDRLKAQVPQLDLVCPALMRNSGNVIFKDKKIAASFRGQVPDYAHIEPPRLYYGRYLNEMDIAQSRKVCVIGKRVYKTLFPAGGNPCGKRVEVDKQFYQVVGVDYSDGSITVGGRSEESVIIPLTVMQSNYNMGDSISYICMTVRNGSRISSVIKRVREVIGQAHDIDPTDEKAITLVNTEVMFSMLDSLFSGVNFLIWLVGIGTLLAGAIGVSNIMMITVRERTTEIGIRRAIGATPRVILSQILSESVVLTTVAGMSGILVSVLILQMIELGNTTDGIVSAHFQVHFWMAIGSLLLLSLLGVLAGLAPAARAMSIKPVDAMRDE